MKSKGYPYMSFVITTLIVVVVMNIDHVSSEAFSSTANLVQLVKSEKAITSTLENVIYEEEQRLEELKRYIDEIQSKNVSSEADPLFYVGHPVNAFNLIKRWYRLSSMTAYTKDYTALTEAMSKLDLPSQDDFTGALAAVLRLQRTFDLRTDDIANGQILNDAGDGPLSTEDCLELGKIALRNKDYGLAAEWLEKVIETAKDPSLTDVDTFISLTRAYEKMGNIPKAAHYARQAAMKDETDDELRENNNRLQQKLQELNKNDVMESNWKRHQTTAQKNYEKLCRGEIDALDDPEYAKNLVCTYRAGILPYILYKEEVLSWDPRIGMFYDVISDKEAEMIKTKAYPMLNRGMVGTVDSAKVSRNRVSKVAWLWDEDEEIKYISQRVKDCTGLDTQYRNPLSSAEPFQVVNYGIGGQYEPHLDFSTAKNTQYPDYLQNTGERLATFLFYLTDVKHGGSTVFPKLNIRVPPVKNGAAFWFNAKLSGEYDLRTEHAGCPVLLGQKWVSNKWIRAYGQEFRRKCALTPDAVDRS